MSSLRRLHRLPLLHSIRSLNSFLTVRVHSPKPFHKRTLSTNATSFPFNRHHFHEGRERSRTRIVIGLSRSCLAPGTFTHIIQPCGISVSQQHIKSFSSSSSKKRGTETQETQEKNQESLTEDPPSSQSSEVKKSQELLKQGPFPWRESATQPLERIIAGDDLSSISNDTKSKFVKRVSTGFELGAPFWQVFFTKRWEYELAENASWAFTMGISGLLSRVFGVSIWDIQNTPEGGLQLDTYTAKAEENNLDEEEEGESEDGNGKYDASAFVESMVQDNLLKLYQSSPTDSDNKPYRIRFSMKPIESRLFSAIQIPSLTREDVQKDESLRGAYTDIAHVYEQSKDMSTMQEMADKMMKATYHNGLNRSIIIDVSIDCMEVFQVFNSKNELIQGSVDGAEERVSHCVRLEMVTTPGEEKGQRVQGQWKIIDIDDFLDGNKWH